MTAPSTQLMLVTLPLSGLTFREGSCMAAKARLPAPLLLAPRFGKSGVGNKVLKPLCLMLKCRHGTG